MVDMVPRRTGLKCYSGLESIVMVDMVPGRTGLECYSGLESTVIVDMVPGRTGLECYSGLESTVMVGIVDLSNLNYIPRNIVRSKDGQCNIDYISLNAGWSIKYVTSIIHQNCLKMWKRVLT